MREEASQIRTVKSTACSKENQRKTKHFIAKLFFPTFHTSTHLFNTCASKLYGPNLGQLTFEFIIDWRFVGQVHMYYISPICCAREEDLYLFQEHIWFIPFTASPHAFKPHIFSTLVVVDTPFQRQNWPTIKLAFGDRYGFHWMIVLNSCGYWSLKLLIPAYKQSSDFKGRLA